MIQQKTLWCGFKKSSMWIVISWDWELVEVVFWHKSYTIATSLYSYFHRKKNKNKCQKRGKIMRCYGSSMDSIHCYVIFTFLYLHLNSGKILKRSCDETFVVSQNKHSKRHLCRESLDREIAEKISEGILGSTYSRFPVKKALFFCMSSKRNLLRNLGKNLERKLCSNPEGNTLQNF